MISIKIFCFGPFEENTYVLYDETKECVVIDPGCYNNKEQQELFSFIQYNKLELVKLLNTHCHVDHVFGNKFIHDKYGLLPIIHRSDLNVLHSLLTVANLYGLNAEASPEPIEFINEGMQIKFGSTVLDIVFTPGHSPGSVCFINHPQKIVMGGDVLFYGSIGRTDLPGGDHETLLNSIRTKLFVLGDDYKVYPGHGQETIIGFEKKNNPFLNE